MVTPLRSESQRRLYRESDINRLTLLKALVDRSQAIGSIADLDTADLEHRLQQSAGTPRLTSASEKPRLAQLITSLVCFEMYSSEYESRSSEDAVLHSYLRNTTSHARHMMERALARVVELENLSPLPDS